MVPDNPGIWMFHCHIDDQMDAGMATLYKVEP
jgi:FtsP/CotA-like multicopper oxidase with cupredoxin domain